jgi:hypothetical protein
MRRFGSDSCSGKEVTQSDSGFHSFPFLFVQTVKLKQLNQGWWVLAKEVLQKESGRRLCYIYSRCTCMELFQRSVAPLVLKFGIHQGQA